MFDDAEHRARVDAVSAAVRARPANCRLSVKKLHGSHSPYTDLSAHKQHSEVHPIDVSSLHHILAVNEAEGVVVAEGEVTMGQLLAALLPRGLMPALPCEGRDFTVSGLLAGSGIQSRSWHAGLFADTVTALEVVTGRGELLHATPDNAYADLFSMLPGSLGSLGIVTAAALRLVPAGPLLRTSVHVYRDLPSFAAAITAACKEGTPTPTPAAGCKQESMSEARRLDFLEGLVFSRDLAVVLRSRFMAAVDPQQQQEQQQGQQQQQERHRVYDTTQPGAPYFYQYIQQLATTSPPGPSATQPAPSFDMDTAQHIFRYERGVWWILPAFLGLPLLTTTHTGRALLDKAMATGSSDRGSSKGKDKQSGDAWRRGRGWQPQVSSGGGGSGFTHRDLQRCLVQQGFFARASRLHTILEACIAELGIFPMWVCPVRATAGRQGQGGLWRALGTPAILADQFIFDIGCYGVPTAPSYRSLTSVRKLQSLCDCPTSFGLIYMTRQEIAAGIHSGAALPTAAADDSGGKQLLAAAELQALRVKYGAEGVFAALADKAGGLDCSTGSAVAEDADAVGVIRYWRLKRDGLYYPCVYALLLALAVVAVLLARWYVIPAISVV